MPHQPLAIVDIGSNSVRLVVYSGPRRTPTILFNEKILAGLGRDLGATGALSDVASERALAALARFRILTRQMGVSRTRVVATAAVRDASNGNAFMAEVRALGFKPEVLSGRQEGEMAGLGVISGIPDADGIVGDLGGGSLELVDVSGGKVVDAESLPLGVLRLEPLMQGGGARLRAAIAASRLQRNGRGRPLYLVGGSWRSLARLDMLLTDHSLPITHQYSPSIARLAALEAELPTIGKAQIKALGTLSVSRMPDLPNALALLRALVAELRPSELVVSAFGIREGMLYDDLDAETRACDPLIEAVRDAGRKLGRFPEHGALLDDWIAPVFADDAPDIARLRLAACLLSDVAWAAHPDFRAERGMYAALHGNWVGIDLPGRVMVAHALFRSFGGGREFLGYPFASLCTREQLDCAARWGLAIRLGHRLSGGVAAALEQSGLKIEGEVLRLTLRSGAGALYSEPVERRLATLAQSLGLKAVTAT
jgi:exopolyphosphatase/guanosine-5'-triphosphate,3'-diphosphate pyrophosphatase